MSKSHFDNSDFVTQHYKQLSTRDTNQPQCLTKNTLKRTKHPGSTNAKNKKNKNFEKRLCYSLSSYSGGGVGTLIDKQNNII